ncbi:unnamed protein product [Symbiodinium natans]|uniref:Uncharacterized protein n=1 Tax=Symbiodinium natans TaxID=878477 RepID=A0A812I1Y3_9DINO|nr:unnamed protein product [Symbiodinium natans]
MTRAFLFTALAALGAWATSRNATAACSEEEVGALLQMNPTVPLAQNLSILDFLEELTRASVPNELTALRRRFVEYYREAGSEITRSAPTDLGQVVDCVPFLKQPALLWATREEKHEALELWAESEEFEDQNMEYYGCARDEIPLPRPSLHALRLGLVQEFRKTGSPTGGLWPATGSRPQLSLLQSEGHDCRTIKPPHPGPPNYTYSTSPICKTHDSHQAFTILEVGGSLPVPEVPTSGGHTLNQMWWKGLPPQSELPVSMEAGWLASDPDGGGTVGTRLFVYSTPNAYLPKDDCEGGNHYDHWGGFVHYPGTPALGVYSTKEVRSVFIYQTVGPSQGVPERVEFYLAPLDTNYRKTGRVESKQLVGYWPRRHYCHGFPNHEDLLLYTGLEVYVPSQCPGTPRTASGRILGWGTHWNHDHPHLSYPMVKGAGKEAVFLATSMQDPRVRRRSERADGVMWP